MYSFEDELVNFLDVSNHLEKIAFQIYLPLNCIMGVVLRIYLGLWRKCIIWHIAKVNMYWYYNTRIQRIAAITIGIERGAWGVLLLLLLFIKKKQCVGKYNLTYIIGRHTVSVRCSSSRFCHMSYCLPIVYTINLWTTHIWLHKMINWCILWLMSYVCNYHIDIKMLMSNNFIFYIMESELHWSIIIFIF